MESIRQLYRIGFGPSSSHTMGPARASSSFLEENKGALRFTVTLYGSLAATGKGHLTDVAIQKIFSGYQLEIIWKPGIFLPFHPNGMKFEAYNASGNLIAERISYSVGGGAVVQEGEQPESKSVYQLSKLTDILSWCHSNGKQLWEFVEENENEGIWNFFAEIWAAMNTSIKNGLSHEGNLPGGLRLSRKASAFKMKAGNFTGPFKRRAQLFAFAQAVSEENACGGMVVTAPTCGSSGVLPAILKYHQKAYKVSLPQIYKALATAGLIGILVKNNASISGAEVGCQGEIGTACAMASAAATQLMGGTINQIEYAAEMGLEHHLGLTCDPVAGLVQIPCIERNSMAAERALAHNTYAQMSDGLHRISFDEVVETMYQTGKDLSSPYKETGTGGLARIKR
ncbi:MAG: L-serine ammonia-lyase [Mangrovibacterium sp.]|nr:L-serine ammonia-lyase [Mangrovibacterium sp.]